MLKTKIGAILAGAYLTIVFVVSIPFLFDIVANGGEGGGHSSSGMSLVFAMTSPMSWPALSAVDNNFSESTEIVSSVLAGCVLAICALVNAAIIYLFTLAVTRVVQSVTKRSPP